MLSMKPEYNEKVSSLYSKIYFQISMRVGMMNDKVLSEK